MSVNEKMTAIADAIRDKTKGTEALSLDDMAAEIPKVFEKGKKAEYDAFWDVFQNYGDEAGLNYNSAFANGSFTDANYNPKYPIITSNASTHAQTIFIYAKITDTKVPVKVLGSKLNQTFAYSDIVRIAELNIHENVVFDRTFYRAGDLEEINVTGTIGQDGFDIQWSKKLNKASIVSIINALSDSTSGLTVALSQTAVDNAFTTEEWSALESTKGNWTIKLE